jgi:hypothetical protein
MKTAPGGVVWVVEDEEGADRDLGQPSALRACPTSVHPERGAETWGSLNLMLLIFWCLVYLLIDGKAYR